MTSGIQVDKPNKQQPIAPQPTLSTPEVDEEKQVAIVYNPKIENRTNTFIFSCPRNLNQRSGDNKQFLTEALETERICLVPGSQLVNAQLWEKLKNYPPSGKEISRMMRKGVIRELRSNLQGDFQTSTTLDFELDDALEIVANSPDIEWLRLCIAKDNRSQVYNACKERIKTVEEMKKGNNLQGE